MRIKIGSNKQYHLRDGARVMAACAVSAQCLVIVWDLVQAHVWDPITAWQDNILLEHVLITSRAQQ